MSWSATQLENDILRILRMADGVDGVRTWESELREVFFTGEQLSKGFRSEELPAVNVTTAVDATRSTQFTAGEIQFVIPVQIIAVTRSPRKDEARSSVLTLLRALERPLNAARRTDGLGPNTFVIGDLLCTHDVVQDKPHHFGVGNITITVQKVEEL